MSAVRSFRRAQPEPSERNAIWRHKRAIAGRLLRWFDSRSRDLPWLKDRSAYKVWVSEVMLQQTQLAAVIDYYHRFIRRFPSVQQLADATLEDVLKQWEGLGYYRRARQLHAAARIIVERHGGEFPQEFSDVLSLPGVGRYTAAAILSIAGDQKLPILEGNSVRLFSRLIALATPSATAANQKLLWELSARLQSHHRAGDFNQAVMDFGREICKPSKPDCGHCPLSEFCLAFATRQQHRIPVRRPSQSIETVREAVVIVRRNDRFLLRQYESSQRWGGLWDFLRIVTPADDSIMHLQSAIEADTGLQVEIEPLNRSILHAVTRFKITLVCYRSSSVRGRLRPSSNLRWKTAAQISELPMHATGRRIARLFAT
jgi:A/G-specific adenine glycosylase